MSSLSGISRPLTVSAPPVESFQHPARPPIICEPALEEPEEFCPIALLWLCRRHWNWSLDEFSWVFGWNHDTIRKWAGKRQKPSKQARIRAATLKQEWKI